MGPKAAPIAPTKEINAKTYAAIVELCHLMNDTHPRMQAGGVGEHARAILKALGEEFEVSA